MLSDDLKNIMDYIYNGKVQIYQEDLDRFLTVAQRLKLEGLIGGDANEEMINQESKNEGENIVEEEEQNLCSVDPINKFKSQTKVSKNEAIQPLGTVAIAVNGEDRNAIKEQVLQYMKDCDDGSYSCSVCGKKSKVTSTRTIQKEGMMKHIETHIEGLSYSCPVCHKVFRSRNSLTAHKSVYHKSK